MGSDNVDFAYINATEGGDFVDDRFEQNWIDAAAAGLDRGAYHFFTLCRPGAEQAAKFLDVVPPDPTALPPAVDLELAGNCSERPEEASVERELASFLGAVEATTGQRVVLYIRDDFEDHYHLRDKLDRPYWQRRLVFRPAGDRRIWQVLGRARVDGISGDVDLDVMRGDGPPAS